MGPGARQRHRKARGRSSEHCAAATESRAYLGFLGILFLGAITKMILPGFQDQYRLGVLGLRFQLQQYSVPER